MEFNMTLGESTNLKIDDRYLGLIKKEMYTSESHIYREMRKKAFSIIEPVFTYLPSIDITDNPVIDAWDVTPGVLFKTFSQSRNFNLSYSLSTSQFSTETEERMYTYIAFLFLIRDGKIEKTSNHYKLIKRFIEKNKEYEQYEPLLFIYNSLIHLHRTTKHEVIDFVVQCDNQHLLTDILKIEDYTVFEPRKEFEL